MIYYSYPFNIEEAVKVLDKAKPGWYKLIDLGTLDMTEGRQCVLGQVFGGYHEGIHRLFGPNHKFKHGNDSVFGTGASNFSWKEWIKSRKLTDESVPLRSQAKPKTKKDKLAKIAAVLTRKSKTVTLIKQKRKQLEKLKREIDKLMATL